MTAPEKTPAVETAEGKEPTAKAPAKRGRPAKGKSKTVSGPKAKVVTPTVRVKMLEEELENTRGQFGKFIQDAQEKNGNLISELQSTRTLVDLRDQNVSELIKQNTQLRQELLAAHQELAKYQTTGAEG